MATEDRINDGSNVCRFCPSIGECVSLFDSANFPDDIEPAEIVFELCKIFITPEDDGPRHICKDKCLARLVDYYFFKRQILQAEEQRRALQKAVAMKIEIEIVTDDEDAYEAEFLLYEEEGRDKIEEDQRDHPEDCSSTENFILPPKEMILTRLEFDNFDYVEYQGEKCCGCNAFLGSMGELETHAEEMHGTRSTQNECSCPVCGRRFPNETDLEDHAQLFRSKELFLCKVCFQGFQGKDLFTTHMDSHQLTSNDEKLMDAAGHDSSIANSELVNPAATDDHNVEEDYHSSSKSHSQQFSPKLPDQTLISSVEDYDQYQIIHLDNAERCCGCGLYFGSFEQLIDHARLLHHPEHGAPRDTGEVRLA